MREKKKPYIETNGNKSGNKSMVVIPHHLFKIYILLTKHHYSASGKGKHTILHAMKYNSRGTVSKNIKKLKNLGLIECVNPMDQVKFYKAIPGIKIISSKETNTTEDEETRLGREPNICYDGIVKKDGQRVPLSRTHSKSYIAPVTGGPIEDVKWDHANSPNNRFKEFHISWFVPEIGNVSFCWKKSKNKSNLVIYLPERYLTEHELVAEDEVMYNLAWRAAQWFSKNAFRLKRKNKGKRWRIGIGILLPYRPTSYGFEAPKEIIDYVNEFGYLQTRSVNGSKVEIDQSKKPFTEIEFENRDEALAYMNMPGRIVKADKNLKETKDWIGSFEDNFSKFLKLYQKNIEIESRRWREQVDFNQEVRGFMHNQEFKNSIFSDALGIGKPSKQVKLDRFILDDQTEMMFG